MAGCLRPSNPLLLANSLARIILLLAIVPAIALAQAEQTGTITGHVRGPGGVSVPGATVEITQLSAGERKVTWTDEAGNYCFPDVVPGAYRLEVSLVGFRKDAREPVPVTAGKSLAVNVALVIDLPNAGEAASRMGPGRSGGTSTGPENLAMPEGQLQARLGGQGVEGSLPEANGGSTEGNVRFAEGATSTATPAGDAGSVEENTAASAANSFLLAGSTGISASMPGDDERRMRGGPQEFRGRGEGPQAPGFSGGGPGFGAGGPGFGGGPMGGFFGGPGGGWGQRRPQVNRLRGNIFEQYSNSAINARPYPLNVPESPQIPSYREQLGVGLGGPLVIPKIYNGKDKTSFFVNYNLQRARSPFDSFATVPTELERQGDFSQAVIPSGPLAGTVPIIYDPASNPAGPRTPFPDNRIPSELLDPAALGLLKYIPLPNLPGSVENFHLQQALPSSNDRVIGRIGHQVSPKDSVNAAYFFNSSRTEAVSNFPGLTRHTSIRGQNFNLSETHTFGPRFLNTLQFNFNRQRSSMLNPFAFQEDVAGDLGIRGVSSNPFDWGLPLLQFTNFTGLNDVIPSLTRNQTLRWFDFVILSTGKHNLRFGGELRRVQLNTLTDPDARGTFTFSGFTTSDFTAGGFPVPGTGFDFADFLLGLPQATSVRFGTSSNYFRSWVYSLFGQDDWRLSSRLTLNYGLRYEYFLPFTEKYGHLSDLALGENFSSVEVVTGQAPGLLPDSLVRGDGNNLAPRLGIAFRPWTRRRLVLRAGYGIFYDGSIYSRLVPNLASQPPFAQASTLLTTPQQVLTLENGFPELGPNIARNTYAVDPSFRAPYAQTWNFSLENEIARDVILSVGYVGTKGTKLDLLLSPNQAAPGSPLTTQDRLGLPNALAFVYETSGAASIYHGLQVGLRRQFHGGFSLSGNYTLAKSIDDAASVGGAGRTVAQNSFDLQAERGLSVFDVRHRLVLNHTYEFPFGDRRRWLSHGGTLARLVGNWQISGVATIQSGNPFTARVLGNQSNNSGTNAGFSERADATGQPVMIPGFEQTTQRFFNIGAFTLPAPGRYGNAGRNTIPGPGTVNFNMSLDRFITLSREKGVRADFRVDAANIFNTPNFSGLATVVNAQDFGRITSVKAMRVLTFSLRVRF
jgi:hypothetical protein